MVFAEAEKSSIERTLYGVFQFECTLTGFKLFDGAKCSKKGYCCFDKDNAVEFKGIFGVTTLQRKIKAPKLFQSNTLCSERTFATYELSPSFEGTTKHPFYISHLLFSDRTILIPLLNDFFLFLFDEKPNLPLFRTSLIHSPIHKQFKQIR